MATTNGRIQTEQVEGVVEATNANGLRLAGTSSWLNVSRFHTVPLPDAGAHVRIDVDARGYIREIEVLDSDRTGTTSTIGTSSSRDQTITRLALIKAAAVFAASRPDMKAADVVLCARAWERYVTEDA